MSGSLRSKVQNLEEFKLFNDWQMTHEKKYEDQDEMLMRFGIFYDNLQYINAHNSKESNFTMGLQWHSDMTFEEFAA
jgi:hypothetical protein